MLRPQDATVAGLVALARFDPQSALFLLEQALEAKLLHGPLSSSECLAHAVCALQRELDAGGYDAFLANVSRRHATCIVEALTTIGCPAQAAIAADAVATTRPRRADAGVGAAAVADENALRRALAACDARREACPESPARALLCWMQACPDAVVLP